LSKIKLFSSVKCILGVFLMSSSKLLEQAIVDAQALRDSAYKSAQAALLEKFAPQVKEAVEKLLEQDEEDEMSADTPSPTDALAGGQSDMPTVDFGGAPPDESNKGYVAGTASDIPLAATDGEKLCPCPDDEEEVSLEINLADLADQLQIGDKEEEPGSMGLEQTPPAMGGTGLAESLELESIELEEDTLEEEVLAEVDLDEALSEMSDIEVGSGYEGVDDPKELMRQLNQAEAEEQELIDKLKPQDKELYLANPGRYKIVRDESHVGKELYTLRVPSPQEIFTPGEDDGSGPFTAAEELSPKQQKIASAAPPADKITGADFAALRADKKEIKESKTKDLLKASQALLKEVENKDARINKLLEENKTFSSTIEQMSVAFKKLEEVNLLNARLFYENQILKSASLNERQKTQIVEAVSKADSVSEAKTIYETLINSVGGHAKEERSPKSLNEAISKKSSFRLPHKQAEQPVDQNKDRWLRLAGIK
jgi:hypothetical protein